MVQHRLHECLCDLQQAAHRIAEPAVTSSVIISVALAAVVPATSASHAALTLQEIGQPNAKLSCNARQYSTGDQRHDHEEEELRWVAPRIVI